MNLMCYLVWLKYVYDYLREGHLCDDCVRLPGCEHGTCDNAFECNCLEREIGGENKTMWEGAFCDKREGTYDVF